MATLNLSEDEATILHDVLRYNLTELQSEISHTDDRDFKTALKRRQAMLKGIVGSLESIRDESRQELRTASV